MSEAPPARLGPHAAAVQDAIRSLESSRFAARLAAHDDALWGDDPAHRKVAANRLGWLESPAAMRGRIAELEAFAAEVIADGFTNALLLGMGGSSLAPEVLRLASGYAAGALDLSILDNTSPAAVRAAIDEHDLARTLVIVSSKSGGTIEVTSFEKALWERVSAARGADAGRAFVAITDPSTSLGALALSRGYRRTFANPPDIGGRYSALSYFGLVPAALLGQDLGALLTGALAERATLDSPDAPAVRLGATLGALARAGVDKLTLVPGPGLRPVGAWIEQLVAESTGKSGRGIVPVNEERLAGPEAYGADRVFVATSLGPLPSPTARALDRLVDAGHPVLYWALPSLDALGAEFVRWEIATAAAAAVLEVDPFDEPNVAEAKEATKAVLDRALREGRFPERVPVAEGSGLRAYAPPAVATALGARANGDPAACAAAVLALVLPGEYVAVLAYLHRTDSRRRRLQSLRHAVRDATRAATTLGIGPRFLHSTGQLHKGGPDRAVFLQLTADEGDVPIPGEPYGFATLRAAQAAGDFDVLERRGRRVVRVHVGADIEAGLDRLRAAVSASRS